MIDYSFFFLFSSLSLSLDWLPCNYSSNTINYSPVFRALFGQGRWECKEGGGEEESQVNKASNLGIVEVFSFQIGSVPDYNSGKGASS